MYNIPALLVEKSKCVVFNGNESFGAGSGRLFGGIPQCAYSGGNSVSFFKI